MPRDAHDTTPEIPAVDDEATRIDPKPSQPTVSVPTVPTRPKFDGGADEDDEATKHTGPPKKAREAQKILEESRRMNAAGGPKPPAKKLHPLIPLGTALAILAVLLLLINWMVKPAPTADGAEPPQSSGWKLFDW